MSFYGNIKRVNSSPFVFDKYYPNRKAMADAMTTDNVYIGRFVLVKYTCGFVSQENGEQSIKYFDKQHTYFQNIVITESEYEPNKYYILNNNQYTLATGVFQSSNTYYTLIKTIDEAYQENEQIDIETYHDTFDATVWQKIYTQTAPENKPTEKYILIAELNADAPRLDFSRIAPKYFTEDGEEAWNTPHVSQEGTSEDIFRINMPDILKLEVNDLEDDFYGKKLIETPEKRTTYQSSYNLNDDDDPMSPDFNYMRWDNIRFTDDGQIQRVVSGDIDGKKLETKLYAFGQMISDLYDALYGVPKTDDGTGMRPFYTKDLSNILSLYDKGLVGILSSIGTEAKGDMAQDLYGRSLSNGMHYYFTTKWNDALEDPYNFIENIPNVIGASPDNGGSSAKSQYFINFNATDKKYISKNWTGN